MLDHEDGFYKSKSSVKKPQVEEDVVYDEDFEEEQIAMNDNKYSDFDYFQNN